MSTNWPRSGGLLGEVPGWGPALALLRGLTRDTRTGHGELKLESGEWEAADKAISRALHRAPVSSSCSINLILGASLPPPADEEAAQPSGRPRRSRAQQPPLVWEGAAMVLLPVTPEGLTENP